MARAGRSRGVHQRISKRRATQTAALEVVASLNLASGLPSDAIFAVEASSQTPSIVQRRTLECMFADVERRAPCDTHSSKELRLTIFRADSAYPQASAGGI